MFDFLKKILGFFSSYVNSFERKVDKFFKGIKSNDSHLSVERTLLKLMQKNLVVVNVWMERKYKGYKYLSKGARRKMYADTGKIVELFQEFTRANGAGNVESILRNKGLSFPKGDAQKIAYLRQIMLFLKPGKFYKYIKTASFGKLLRDPMVAKMEGDCNQIVTFYAYLYSLKYPLKDLQIKLLPGHVCLHFKGIDIEATNGTFQKYKEKQILPITEIISTNLLDLSDFREDVQVISERTMVKSAQLAYAISSLKELVAKNLKVTYRNLAIAAMKEQNFDSAIFYFESAGDAEGLKSVYRNAAVYNLDQHNSKSAKFYADKTRDAELLKSVRHQEGYFYYKKGNYDRALEIFSSLGDSEMKKACYSKQYNLLVKKVAGVKTLKQAKNRRSVYKAMLLLAQKMGDSQLERSVRKTLSEI
ncbi:hypothetical protein JKY72_07095 [Candidatus Gracilibacteria bacterium]|nr:hypothetical protein [Candidatus Gracilibacteria bacterium]